jgi:hypothetical protein
MVMCLIKKSVSGYIGGFKAIVVMLQEFVNWVFNGKLSKDEFISGSFALSLVLLEIIGMFVLPGKFIVLWAICIWVGIPFLMIPIYNAVFYCYADEDKKSMG